MGHITSRRRRRLSTTLALWALQTVLALGFASLGLMKLLGAPLWVSLFAEIGVGQWLRYAVGSIQIAAALGLVIPLLAAPAAMGLTTLMVGATVTAILIDYDPSPPLGLAAMSALVLYGRWRELRALPDQLRRLPRHPND